MIGLHEDPFSTPPPEPLKTQVLRLLLLTYTVWCDADHLRSNDTHGNEETS